METGAIGLKLREAERMVPKYVEVLEKALRDRPDLTKPGSVNNVLVLHDDWCGIYTTRICNCNFEIVLPERPS